MKKIGILLILLTHLTACDNNSDKASILGVWHTEACEQAPDTLGSNSGSWGKGRYEFTDNNIINVSIQFYTGASCSITSELIEAVNINSPLTFIDFGQVTLEEGIEGNQFYLTLPIPDAPSTIEGFYTLNNSKLCFSDNINFNPYSVSSSEIETTAIDFEKCLVKQ